MYKRLLLAVMLATVLVLPVSANVTSESKCDVSALGVFDGAVELEPDWTPESFSCPEGKYLDAQSAECKLCPSGSYCSGFEDVPYNDSNLGISTCQTDWTSDEGTVTESGCYKLNPVTCSERNPYTYGHGSAVYANTNTVCKNYFGTEDCFIENSQDCDIISLNCDTGYRQDTVAGDLQCVRAKLTCDAGTYMPGNSETCVPCPGDSYCSGGEYDILVADAQGISACASGLFAPVGARSENDCGRILHVGDNILYLHKDKRTEHSLVVNVEGVNYYADATPISEGIKTMDGRDATEQDVGKVLRINIDGAEYSVHDTIYE